MSSDFDLIDDSSDIHPRAPALTVSAQTGVRKSELGAEDGPGLSIHEQIPSFEPGIISGLAAPDEHVLVLPAKLERHRHRKADDLFGQQRT